MRPGAEILREAYAFAKVLLGDEQHAAAVVGRMLAAGRFSARMSPEQAGRLYGEAYRACAAEMRRPPNLGSGAARRLQ